MSRDDLRGEMHTKAAAAAAAIYRLSAAGSADGALRFVLRKRAVEILADLTALAVYSGQRRSAAAENFSAAIAGIQELIRFAGSIAVFTPEHASLVSGAYRRVGECAALLVTEEMESGGVSQELQHGGAALPGERQRRILGYVRERGRTQISDIRQAFVGKAYSEKTIQRDLWHLVNIGLLERQGDNRWTTYISIGHDVSDSYI